MSQKHKKATDDSRFEEVFTNPIFTSVPHKVKKVAIDKRFKKKLNSKKFNVVSKVDKYGRKVKSQDKTMKEYY